MPCHVYRHNGLSFMKLGKMVRACLASIFHLRLWGHNGDNYWKGSHTSYPGRVFCK